MTDYDLVVYGATGFTGRLVAEYLAQREGPERIALGGRSEGKLRAVREELGVEWPLIVADAHDDDALDAMARSTRAVITTVGPYWEHGLPLVGACARNGTHYADLTGEVLFMRESIERFDAVARESGARIVHASGFDSVPSDLGVLLLREAAGGPLGDTLMALRWASGWLSGGTVASGVRQMEAVAREPALRAIVADPYALTPGQAGVDVGDQRWVRHEQVLDSWTAPFIMAAVNSRVVRRSNMLADFAYGRDFRYKEVVATGPGLTGRALAVALAAGSTAGTAAMSIGPVRSVATRFLPGPGDGPSQRTREHGGFRVEFRSSAPDSAVYGAEIIGHGDPGYQATSRMLAESGLELAAGDGPGGVLTPAAAMGGRLVDRLRNVGMSLRAWQVR